MAVTPHSGEELLPVFFLGRAVGDDDSYALRFFRDLSSKVAELLGINGDVGFVDTGSLSQSGGRSWWRPAAWDAVMSCQSFVALCSPKYLLDERCGRELWLFSDRLGRYEQVTACRSRAFIPVLWSSSAALGRGGTDPDVSHLIRLRSLRPRYEAYVMSLAERIVAVTQDCDIPAGNPDLDPETVPNVFDGLLDEDFAIQLCDLKDYAAATGFTQRVHFVVAAGNRTEMAAVRADLQFYGEQGQDWAPYRPVVPGALAEHARTIAATRLFGSDVVGLDGLPGRIDAARRNNEIVVLLVDSWVTRLSAYRQALMSCDEQRDPAVAILAPANDADMETARHRGELRSALTEAFGQSLARGDQLVRVEIGSADSFETDLVGVLETIQGYLFGYGHVFRRPLDSHDASVGRPILQGP